MWTNQSNFTKGEVDPQLNARFDTEAFYQGVKTAKNVLLIPQGGLKVRYGTEYLSTAVNGRLEEFQASDGTNYQLLFANTKMYVYKDGVLQININGSGNDYLTITHTLAQVQEMDYVQAGDTFILTHEDVAPHRVITTNDTTWTLSTSFLTNIPQFDYNDASSPAGTAEVQSVVFANATESDRFKLSLYGILTEELVYGGVTNTTERTATAANMQEALQDHPLIKGKTVTVVWASGSTFTVTLPVGLPYPVNIITASPVQTQSVSFKTNTTITITGVSRAENVWSAGRGWPRTVTFHEGRLYFGGSKSLVQTVWGSNVNDYYNFRSGKALDDNAVTFSLATDRVNKITSIFSNKALQIFTTDSEFVVSESPITPENVAANKQTSNGAKRVRPINLDGASLYVQKTGKSLNNFEYLNDYNASKSVSVSLLSPHLIKDPTKLALRKGTDALDATYVYIVNTDGTVTILNSLATEGIAAFTRWETDGNVKSICVSGNDLYFLIERVINGSTVYYLEKENSLLATDCALRSTGLASDTLTGLSHLEAEDVTVRALTLAEVNNGLGGGSSLGVLPVVSGQIVTPRTYDTIEAGLDYTVQITTMPLNVSGFQNAFEKKRIKRVGLDLYESNGVLVNGHQISDKVIGQSQFDAPQPFTGKKRIFLGGWSIEASVTITRGAPTIFQILSLGLEVKL